MTPRPAPSDGLSRVALAILAGGEGRRMGGPKDRLIARGKPILRYVIENIQWPGPTLLVLGKGRDEPAGREACGRVVRDEVSGEGPLRGILTAVQGSGAEATVVMPVDMPWLARGHLAFLIGELTRRPALTGILLSRPTGGEPRIEPFPCIFRAQASALIRRQLAKGRFAIRDLAADSSIGVVSAPTDWPADVWNNVNAPGDLPDWITIAT